MAASSNRFHLSPASPRRVGGGGRSRSSNTGGVGQSPPPPPVFVPSQRDRSDDESAQTTKSPKSSRPTKKFPDSPAAAKARARRAQIENDAMVYLDGPLVYTCGQCRTHLTSHDDIISKSFHGRHGRAYLFDQCVNVTVGPAEDRLLITGMHSVCDIFCKRCKGMVGWTYAKAYEPSQKYKEGKFIIEKINLHLEESDYYDVSHPAGERHDRWRIRSMSWGSERSMGSAPMSPQPKRDRANSKTPSSPRVGSDVVYEYRPVSSAGTLSPGRRAPSFDASMS